MADTDHQKLHAIMISFPFQGHLNPFVNLAINLASKGFTITFSHTEYVHQQITKSQTNKSTTEPNVFTEARKSGLDIRYMAITDGLPLDFDRSVENFKQYWDSILTVFPNHVDEFVKKIIESADSSSSKVFLITDTFYVWPAKVAMKYNLVNVSFWTQPALVFTLFYHLDLLIKNGHVGSNDNRTDTIDYIPGVQAIEPKDLVSILQQNDLSSLQHRMTFEAFELVKKADILLCNTVEELESETISALNQKLPIYAIGPILPSISTKHTISSSLWSESDCTQWLNTKSKDSVLYISFGSLVKTSEHDILEIAYGLLLSKVNFVWIVRHDNVNSKNGNIMPNGFEDEIKDQGLIVPWCNQIEVLSHSGVGGFLTHCGWNSVLESIWCGVPMICFPSTYDQITNRKLVVDDWKIGINFCDEKSIAREEVAEKINRLMSRNTSDEIRMEVQKIKRTVENSLTNEGSYQKNFDQFIQDVKEQTRKRNGLK